MFHPLPVKLLRKIFFIRHPDPISTIRAKFHETIQMSSMTGYLCDNLTEFRSSGSRRAESLFYCHPSVFLTSSVLLTTRVAGHL